MAEAPTVDEAPGDTPATAVGRYVLLGEIASGGMATVHVGRLRGAVGFSRTVAIKRLHSGFANDQEFASMFIDEARLVSHVRHPNVVPTLDVLKEDKELFLVMELVHGASLARLISAARDRGDPIPRGVVSAIVCGMLLGLHAAHEATNEEGRPLEIVHRDISPENVLVGSDGVPRVLDFGVAKAVGRVRTTRDGRLRGKLAYMAPEQLKGDTADRRTDIYATGVVLWELLTLQRLFEANNEGALLSRVLERVVEPPSALALDVSEALDALTLRAIARDPAKRFESARAMATALEAIEPIASPTRVGEWVESLLGPELAAQRKAISRMEARSSIVPPPASLASPSLSPAPILETVPVNLGPRSRAPMWIAIAVGGAIIAVGAARFAADTRTPPEATKPGTEATSSTLLPVASERPEPERPAVSAAAAPSVTAAPSSAQPSAAPGPVKVPPTGRAPVVASSTPSAMPSAVRSAEPEAAKACPVRSFFDDAGIKHYVRTCE